jgi:hypothetical protein
VVELLAPIAIGLFLIVAAAFDWNWFFDAASVQSPLSLFLPSSVARRALRFFVALLGTFTATLASLVLLGAFD